MGGNFDVFDAFQLDRQNLTRQIFKSIHCLVKDREHPSKYFLSNIWRVSVHQNFPPSKFPAIRYIDEYCYRLWSDQLVRKWAKFIKHSSCSSEMSSWAWGKAKTRLICWLSWWITLIEGVYFYSCLHIYKQTKSTRSANHSNNNHGIIIFIFCFNLIMIWFYYEYDYTLIG